MPQTGFLYLGLFGVTASRLELARMIDGFLDIGLVVPSLPRDEVGPSVEEPEPPPFLTERSRHSLAGDGFDLAGKLPEAIYATPFH
jgi:hypothetical protein